MSLDSEIIKAIQDAIKEEDQSDSVAKRLIAWIEAMSNSELSNTDNSNHLDSIYNVIDITKIQE
ncbi:hypothetical protein I4641_19935 [Waterburya agarophytonicola K14]|uniref:Uncharacterized protein n=1 Tax=Waterburya agarophytonicola KI4 TaxID=2874699 RepID=A0A964BX13_9CYAN|nr:CxC ATPase DNA modification system associated small protein [Waterburya agarophytonicola]MCC0179237.1 hypothetical protein [Waterburya agarophytonicola KI4]